MFKTKMLLVVLCIAFMFTGVAYAQDEPSAESVVVDKDGAVLGYVFDGRGTESAMLFGPKVSDGVADVFGILIPWEIDPYMRYSWDVPKDVADVGGGFALRLSLLTYREINFYALGTVEMDVTSNENGARCGRFGVGGMIGAELFTW